jgi:hypothetical protein
MVKVMQELGVFPNAASFSQGNRIKNFIEFRLMPEMSKLRAF